jgi:hypothetical protein
MDPDLGAVSAWGLFRVDEMEQRYRLGQLAADAALAGRCLAVVAAAAQPFAISDYFFFGPTRAFAALLASRIVFAVACLAVAASLRRQSSPRAYDLRLLAASLGLAVYTLAVSATRPSTYSGHLLLAVILVAVAYCVLPLPLPLQSVPALVLSAGSVWMSWHGGASGPGLTAVWVSFAAANILGVLASHEYQRGKRELFVAALHEAELRGELEKALAEIRTLKGILPICLYCKKVRDGEGRWHQIESYIQSRTNADVSHGVCPDCAERHYSSR